MSELRLAFGDAARRIEERRRALEESRFVDRLADLDSALFGGDESRRALVRDRLGWVRSPYLMQSLTSGELKASVRKLVDRGMKRALLLGMGGSSLAPEVLARVYGPQPGGLPLTVLDDTSPEAVREIAGSYDPATTLVLVASKSGGTIEVASFERVMFARARAALGDKAGQGFVAITDPGTALERQAQEKNYSGVYRGRPDIGGRYSVLSSFGMVPALLLGIDAHALCSSACSELDAFRRGGEVLSIGVALGELALAGRNKLTLVFSRELAPLGAWIEQLVAESTGKEARGILPVDGERLGPPEVYGTDRVFVGVGALDTTTERALDALVAAGHPVLRWPREVLELGAEFMRWELITATAGAVLDVNPFDEPNVAEAKAATKAVLEKARASGGLTPATPRATDGALELHAPPGVEVAGADAAAWARSLLKLARPGDYAALLAFLHRTPARHAALDRIRHAVRDAARVATTIGYGPRYLHSTGQLHKGGPPTGVFLQLTVEDGDEPIPGEWYGFRTLRDAQAAGDLEVLARHGLRGARIHVRGDADAGLARLAEAFETVAVAT